MTAETRMVNYVTEGEVAHLDQHVVYKFFELTQLPGGGLQSTFPANLRRRKLEYSLDMITKDVPGGQGISCIEVEETERNLMMTMRNNTDRLVMYRCVGYRHGEPPLDPHNTPGQIGVLVEAIRPVEHLYSYDDWKKGGKPNDEH